MFFFFNPKLKQTKVGQVKLNRLNDGGGTDICAFTTKKKVLRGMNRKKKYRRNIVTNVR